MVKIDVISGFLGAGKTTLIRKMFESAKIKNEKVVLIENEFGEIGIDGSFLKDSGIEIKEINSGCICCSLVGDFASSMKEVIAKFDPTRIIIEPSGVGKLSDIVNAIGNVDADLKVNILTTVVDGGKVKMYIKNFGEFFVNQVENANTIVVGKVDKISEEKLQESVELIRQVNPNANIVTTNINAFNGDELVEFLEKKDSFKDELLHKMMEEHEEDECEDEECECHHHHHHDEGECCHHHHEEGECCHEHDHDEECECHHHHHDEGECCCHHHEEDECCHEHDHDEECECHHHHHHEEGECCCHHHEEDECCHEHDHDEECKCHHHHHHGHDADEVFTSWGLETVKAFSRDELNGLLNAMANDDSLGMILRSKGILKASDNDSWYYFDYVAGDYEIREGNPDYIGRFVVIGSKLDIEKIKRLFDK